MKKVIQWKEKGGQINSSNLSTFLTKTYECQKNGWELKNTKRLFSVWIEISISFRKTKKVEQAFKKKPNMAFSFFISTNLQNVWSCNGMEISWENFLWRFRFEWNNKRGFLLFSFFTFGDYLAFDQRGCFNSSSFLSFSFKTSQNDTYWIRSLAKVCLSPRHRHLSGPTYFFSKSSASRISSFLPGGKETQVWPWAWVGEIEGGGGRRRLISFQRNFCLLSCRRPMPIAAEGSLWQHQQLQKQQLCPPGGKIVSWFH